MKIDHVGYLVKNIDKAAEAFLVLGYQSVSERTHDEIREVDIEFFEKDGYVIELVSPYTKESVVANLIKTYKNSPYHICYTVPNLEVAIEELRGKGFVAIDDPTPAPAFSNRKVCFLMHVRAGMIELLEEEK
ncbi:MAG: VOC family protein [Eubacterium sp.]|nr:VOC family protein [Eubacterium sp.]